ncbi:hypothetical protein B4N89_21765 [Embleya scabrispora]|uniref:CBM2 domain-containing protein n=1 Tax=Embleya scabrispora TaxID=159449 RepID=A0A1T3P2A2_9ACTN|nr:hypothetical protein [Embleya scabrispora]OPC83213.1 hypothetical protein B4N89_21765 [Embleya scabrispora]
MTRQSDDTARGIVIPLAAVAIVCLLLTSGVFLFAGLGDSDRADGPVSLDRNLPLPAPAFPLPGTAAASPGAGTATAPGPPTTASATRSATRSPSASASANPGASATATRSSAPPAPPVPPPPATTGPADMSVDATVTDSGWGADGTVVITNRTPRPLPAWDLTLTTSGRQSGFTMLYGEDMRTSTDRGVATARGRGPLAPGASVVIEFGLYGRVDAIGCTFTGVTCRVRGLDAGRG